MTNNGCTDGTMAMLRGIDDLRLKVFTNDKPVPGYYNMILGLFNSNGKYVLHCNDRDILCTERLLEFVEFLKNNNYSYISTTRNYLEPTYDLKVYDKGFSSLLNQDYRIWQSLWLDSLSPNFFKCSYQKPDQQADKEGGISPKEEWHATIGF